MIVGAALVLAAQTAAAAPAAPPLSEALGQAASFCEAALYTGSVGLPANATVYMSIPAAAGGVRPLSEIPELVQRFAATQPMGRTVAPNVAVRFLASEGEVWTIGYGEVAACDLMVTNGSDVPALAAALVAGLDQEKGWDSVKAVPASAAMPLSQHVLVKPKPQADDPAYAFRVKVRWPDAPAADRDGVQLDMSYVAGTLKSPAPTK
jgi:hypothetical protein